MHNSRGMWGIQDRDECTLIIGNFMKNDKIKVNGNYNNPLVMLGVKITSKN